MCGYIWTLRKTKQWIEATTKPPVIGFTDHHSLVDMQRQVNIFNTTSRIAANKKLIYALEYASQFNIRLIHKAGKDHKIPDALSRLQTIDATRDKDAPGT
jgi:hypothetical protein